MSDVETTVVETTEELAVVVDEPTPVVVDEPTPVVKTRKARTVNPDSGMSRARALIVEMSGSARKDVVAAIVNEVGVAPTTARSYYQKFYNA